jgi:hypothetical protein
MPVDSQSRIRLVTTQDRRDRVIRLSERWIFWPTLAVDWSESGSDKQAVSFP